MTPPLRRDLRQRSAIEPMIGHMKTDACLARCALKGALHAVLCGCGHNIYMILAHLRAFVAAMLAALYRMFGLKGGLIGAHTGLRPLVA
jgi:IS5 family transposase